MDYNTKCHFLTKEAELSRTKQCEFLDINRTRTYYQLKVKNYRDIEEVMYDIYENYSFLGYRRVHDELLEKGFKIGSEKVRKLKKELNLKTIYPHKNRNTKRKEHDKHPYLLKDLEITYANQVWAIDITYLPMNKGFMYKVALIDLYSRKVLAYKLSNTMHTSFCIDALNEALKKYGKPEIFNSDQGSQFTSIDFTNVLKENDIKISMDGKGRAFDNIFIERYWRTFKYENFFIQNYQNVLELQLGVSKYVNYYNSKRKHYSLNKLTPDEMYFNSIKNKGISKMVA